MRPKYVRNISKSSWFSGNLFFRGPVSVYDTTEFGHFQESIFDEYGTSTNLLIFFSEFRKKK